MAPITVEDFRARCLVDDADSIVSDTLLVDEAVHVTADDREWLTDSLATTFQVPTGSVRLWIVGSAKLGFSTTEKRVRGVVVGERYRPFAAVSDIDVAVVCPGIFDSVWDELSIYAHGKGWLPWDSGKLGDYLVCGWLRPDYFPRARGVRRCDDWWDAFRAFSSEPRFNRHAVRGGLFHSVADLRRYLRRSVSECIHEERGAQ